LPCTESCTLAVMRFRWSRRRRWSLTRRRWRPQCQRVRCSRWRRASPRLPRSSRPALEEGAAFRPQLPRPSTARRREATLISGLLVEHRVQGSQKRACNALHCRCAALPGHAARLRARFVPYGKGQSRGTIYAPLPVFLSSTADGPAGQPHSPRTRLWLELAQADAGHPLAAARWPRLVIPDMIGLPLSSLCGGWV